MKKFNRRKLTYFKFLYPLIYVVLFPFISRKKYGNIKYENILIIDLHLIGDIILLLPFIQDVLNSHKNAKVTLVCGKWANSIIKYANFNTENFKILNLNAPWIKENNLKNWIEYFKLIKNLKKTKWDIGFDMRGDLRNSLLLNLVNVEKRVSYNLMYNGFLLTDILEVNNNLVHLIDYHKNISKIYNTTYTEHSFIPRLKNTNKEKTSTISIHLGASMKLRRPNLNKVNKFLDSIIEKHGLTTSYVVYEVIEDIKISEYIFNYIKDKEINIECWSGNLDSFIEKLSFSSEIYCLDSGPAHIAAALGLKVHVIFGPSSPQYTRPLGENVSLHGLSIKPDCWPCEGVKCINNIYQNCYSQNLLN